MALVVSQLACVPIESGSVVENLHNKKDLNKNMAL